MTKSELENKGYTFVEGLVSIADFVKTKINNHGALCFELVCWAPLLDDPISFQNTVFIEDEYVSGIIFYILEATDKRWFGDVQNACIDIAFLQEDVDCECGYRRCCDFYIKSFYKGEEEYVNFYKSYKYYSEEEECDNEDN